MQSYEINIILMNIRGKIFCGAMLSMLAWCLPLQHVRAQVDMAPDTLECHIIGFNVGPLFPSTVFSAETSPAGVVSHNATMASLYKGPYLGFGLDALYKHKSGWMVTTEGDIWFGSNNMQHREERLGSVYTRDKIVIGANGIDANVSCYNRGLSFQGGVGKLFPFNPARNPNSGILARVSAGYMRQQTIFMINDERAPQVTGDYALLYDHQRHGFILTEGVGVWLMSRTADYANVYLTFEVSQVWSRSTRQYMIDYYLGLQGKDNNRYFDLLYSIKLCWMFPLKGKTAHDYYFY